MRVNIGDVTVRAADGSEDQLRFDALVLAMVSSYMHPIKPSSELNTHGRRNETAWRGIYGEREHEGYQMTWQSDLTGRKDTEDI